MTAALIPCGALRSQAPENLLGGDLGLAAMERRRLAGGEIDCGLEQWARCIKRYIVAGAVSYSWNRAAIMGHYPACRLRSAFLPPKRFPSRVGRNQPRAARPCRKAAARSAWAAAVIRLNELRVEGCALQEKRIERQPVTAREVRVVRSKACRYSSP